MGNSLIRLVLAYVRSADLAAHRSYAKVNKATVPICPTSGIPLQGGYLNFSLESGGLKWLRKIAHKSSFPEGGHHE